MDQADKLRNLVNRHKGIIKRPEVIIAPPQRQMTMRIIAIASGKGGVGKTSISTNLAIHLMRAGKRVIVIDADFGLANVELMLGVTPRYSFNDVLTGIVTVEEALTTGPEGVKFLSGGSGLTSLSNVSDAQMAVLLDGFIQLDTMADILLIDTGAGISKTVTNFLKASDETVIVTTGDPTAITDAYVLIKTIAEGQDPEQLSLKIIVNKVENLAEGLDVFQRLQRVCTKFLGVKPLHLGSIPYDKYLVRAVKAQEPVSMLYPKSDSNRTIEEISKRVLNYSPVREATGVWQFVDRWMGFMRQ